MSTVGKQIKVESEYNGEKLSELYDRVLVSVGRVPNSSDLGLENTKVELDEKGFVKVNQHQQTGDPSIYAIGDIAGGIMLAHKAHKEARVAVENINGEQTVFENVIIPAVVFTDPELAWCGLTEAEAKEKGLNYQVAKFPWSASGRALSFDRTDGVTKMLVDPDTNRLIGVGICGAGAGELIAEATLAMEMGATAEDIALTVHPHPTLSETLMECAEVFFGHATHTFTKKKAAE
jgi:dihydrolipoamide dehydrogenase